MKILFIEPPYERFLGFRSEWYPMGLTGMATYLSRLGHDARVYHAEQGPETRHMSVVSYSRQFNRYKAALADDTHPVWREVETAIYSFSPDILGLSILTPKVPSALKIARIAKSFNPSIWVVAGGQHPTIVPEAILACKDFDFVIRGEGEVTIEELITVLDAGVSDYASIRGLSYVQDEKIIHNPERPLVNKLDALGFPDREKLFYLELCGKAAF
jgi:radical SAM superfamily enzyme YgiQ (UPF0313 family)